MSFSINSLGGADPTLQYINDFENKEFKNQCKTNVKPQRKEARSEVKVYNQESEDEENDIIGAYVCITPKVSSTYLHSCEFCPLTTAVKSSF